MAETSAVSSHIASADEVEWKQITHAMFKARYKGLSSAAGAGQLGCTLVETPPGKAAWPAHFHYAGEEVTLALF